MVRLMNGFAPLLLRLLVPVPALAVAAALALSACAGAPAAGESGHAVPSITGQVSASAAAPLPAGAELIVRVYDVSRMDAPARVMGEQRQPLERLPAPFQVFYDPAAILPQHTYAVSARVETGGQLLYINTRAHHVITRGQPTRIDVEVEPVARRP
mgnify:CR=1 FL=1